MFHLNTKSTGLNFFNYPTVKNYITSNTEKIHYNFPVNVQYQQFAEFSTFTIRYSVIIQIWWRDGNWEGRREMVWVGGEAEVEAWHNLRMRRSDAHCRAGVNGKVTPIRRIIHCTFACQMYQLIWYFVYIARECVLCMECSFPVFITKSK